LPLFASPAICYSAPDASPQVLKNVRLVYQKGCWHAVLKGSVFITRKAVKMDKPLRLLLQMPNTLSQSDRVRAVFFLIPRLALPYQLVSGKDRLQVSLQPEYDFSER
jgi:hypothetical protein